MIYGMAGVGDGAGCGVGVVRYRTAVRLPLLDLPGGVKRQIWRDRQIQAQAYNWGVADALEVHYRGERILSPRNHSTPLTQWRHKTGSAHSLLLQRGGHWSAVDAVKKWSDRRNQVVYAQRKAVEGTDKTLNALSVFAAKKPAHSAVSAQTRVMSEAVELCRDAQRRRVELVESSDGNALRWRDTPPERGLVEMGVDERAVMIAAAVERSDEALEAFNAALKALRAKIRTVDGTEAARKRLRTLTEKIRKVVAVEAKAGKRLLAHIAKGDERLFRRRRDTERCSGPALVLFDGCVVRDGVLRLPGGTEIPLPAGILTVEDALASHQQQGLVWRGAVHVVDVTDTAGKVTRRTEAEHRKYHVNFLCRAEAPVPEPVVSPVQSLGTDWGVVVPLVCSNGSAYSRYSSDEQQHANQKRHLEAKQLQQSMSNKTEGSRRHTKQQRRRQSLLAKNTDVRVNHQRHVAKAVVTTPGVRKVVLEDTNATNMTASAEGTKTFPVRGSAAKRGLNRSLAESAPARQRTFIERAAVIASVATERVNPAYTSLTCFVCGTLGQRETQALFWCPECGTYTQADVQATLSVNEAGNPGLYRSAQDVIYGGRDSRHKMLEDAVGVFLDSTSADGSVTNKYARSGLAGHSGI